jgi:hypothetical protein
MGKQKMEAGKMIAYKVVQPAWGGTDIFQSARVGNPHFVITYKIGERIKTDHACCFKTLEDAIFFSVHTSYDTGGDIIFSCEIKKSKDDIFLYRDLRGFRNRKELSYASFILKKPKGTVFADSVKLLKIEWRAQDKLFTASTYMYTNMIEGTGNF